MSWLQKKRKSKHGNRWRCKLTLEVLEDRWVPSTFTLQAPLLAGHDGGSFASDQSQTRSADSGAVQANDSGNQQEDSHQSQVAGPAEMKQASEAGDGDPSSNLSHQDHEDTTSTTSGTTQQTRNDGEDSVTGTNPRQQDGSASPTTTATSQRTGSDGEDLSTTTNPSQPEHDDSARAVTSASTQHAGSDGEDSASATSSSQPEHEDSAPTATSSPAQHAGNEGEDSATATDSSQQGHEDSVTPAPNAAPTSTSTDGTSAAGNSSHPVSDDSPTQGTGSQGDGNGTRTIASSSQDVSGSSDGAGPSSTRTSSQSNGGAVSTPLRTFSAGEGNGEHLTNAISNSSIPGGSSVLPVRQLDVSQRPADGFLPQSGPIALGNDSHVVFFGQPNQGVEQPTVARRVEQFLVETPLLGIAGFADQVRGGHESSSAYVPPTTELIDDVLPFNLSELDATWRNLLANLESCVQDLVQWSVQTGLVPFMVAATLSLAALELTRRRLKQGDAQIGLFEAADGKASGLKHFPTGPQP